MDFTVTTCASTSQRHNVWLCYNADNKQKYNKTQQIPDSILFSYLPPQSTTGERSQPLWGQGGGALQRHLGHRVRWRLGHGGCQRGVPAAGLRGRCRHGQQLSFWPRHRYHPAGQRGLQREWNGAQPVPQSGLGHPQLLPLWGCGCYLQRYRNDTAVHQLR